MKVNASIFWLFLASIFLQRRPDSKQEILWHKRLETLGTFSSLKCTDLNQDGILDAVIGAGKNEFENSDSGMMALDGNTGDVL